MQHFNNQLGFAITTLLVAFASCFSSAFVVIPQQKVSPGKDSLQYTSYTDAKQLSRFPSTSQQDETDIVLDKLASDFPGADTLKFSLEQHRPLGCTVEESLADEKFVFVSKVVEGGCADKAGVKVGDVLIGVTGLFGDIESTVGTGVEKVKGFILSRPDTEVLELCVARGTSVLEEHETALVDLCRLDDPVDAINVEACVEDYLASGVAVSDNNNDEECDVENDEDCMVDNLWNMWDEDLPGSARKEEPEQVVEPETKSKVKPWSSRSSPSGTWVRDPTTGKMTNIDA